LALPVKRTKPYQHPHLWQALDGYIHMGRVMQESNMNGKGKEKNSAAFVGQEEFHYNDRRRHQS